MSLYKLQNTPVLGTGLPDSVPGLGDFQNRYKDMFLEVPNENVYQ